MKKSIYIYNPYFNTIGGGQQIQNQLLSLFSNTFPESKVELINNHKFFLLLFSNLHNKIFILQSVFNINYILFDFLNLLFKIDYYVIPRGDYIPLGTEDWKVSNLYLKIILWKVFIKFRLRNANKVIFTSLLEKERYKKVGFSEHNSFIIPDFYDVENRFKNKTIPSKFIENEYFLYVGRISVEKNLEFLLKVFLILKSKFYDKKYNIPKLVLFAPYTNTKYHKSLILKIKKYDLERNIIIYNSKNEIDLQSAYNNTICVLLPSHIESFGLTVIESLYFDKPILISPNVPFNEKPNLNLYKINLVTDHWADIIFNLYTNRKQTENFRNENTKDLYLSNFNFESISAKWKALFNI
jgi:glycosyltransferase involved in cell wall biosynthesis